MLIPAGEFLMGAPEGKEIPAYAHVLHPQHRVRITKPFYLGVYEVTQGQYQAVMGNNPSYFSSNGGGKEKVAGESTDNYPVECLSWLDEVEFCNRLSEKEGLKPFYESRLGRRVCSTGPGQVIACRPRRSGSTPAGRGPRRGSPSATARRNWIDLHGMGQTRTAGRTRSVRKSRTPLACTTCTGTSRSGAGTGTASAIIRSRPWTIRGGLSGPRTGWSGAGAGTTALRPSGRLTVREHAEGPVPHAGLPLGPSSVHPLSPGGAKQGRS